MNKKDKKMQSGDINKFGKALHVLQDSYAHDGYGILTMGHLLAGKHPDNYNEFRKRDIQAKYDSRAWLKEYYLKYGNECDCK